MTAFRSGSEGASPLDAPSPRPSSDHRSGTFRQKIECQGEQLLWWAADPGSGSGRLGLLLRVAGVALGLLSLGRRRSGSPAGQGLTSGDLASHLAQLAALRTGPPNGDGRTPPDRPGVRGRPWPARSGSRRAVRAHHGTEGVIGDPAGNDRTEAGDGLLEIPAIALSSLPIAHSCRRWPPSPMGSSGRGLAAVMNPSNELQRFAFRRMLGLPVIRSPRPMVRRLAARWRPPSAGRAPSGRGAGRSPGRCP
jgi:hypothetical protein